MTEKRFTLDEYYNIEDNYEQKIYHGGEDTDSILDLLNQLNDENEELKQRISEAKSMEFQILYRDIENLKREKEELKYHLDKTEKELQEYKDFMSLG